MTKIKEERYIMKKWRSTVSDLDSESDVAGLS